MRNHQLESRVRENRTHGSEGGEGDSPFLPLSVAHHWIPGQARNDGLCSIEDWNVYGAPL